MNTLTYGTSNMSSKDILAISSLLSLFERRLSAKWVMRNHPPGHPVDVMVVDVDRSAGSDSLREPGPARIRVAVSDNDRTPEQWLVTRPIRAYGANGVVVLFNSLADALESGENPAPLGPRPVQNGAEKHFAAAAAATAVAAPPAPPVPAPLSEPPVIQVRRAAEGKWGPPEPVEAPRLVDMRSAVAEPAARFPEPPRPAPQPPPKTTSAPIPLPVVPSIAAQPQTRQWREPEPEFIPDLIDMRTGRLIPGSGAAPVAAAAVIEESPVPAPSAVPDPVPEPELVAAPAQDPIIEEVAQPAVVELDPEPQAISAEPSIERPESPQILTAQAIPNEFEPPRDEPTPVILQPVAVDPAEVAEDAAADWWNTPTILSESAVVPEGETDLAQLLRDIKRAGKTGVLEIAGLPAVCVVPPRRSYYTSAPAARLEAAIATKTRATFRPCASEDEARSLSGTEDSRQASLAQLYWAAALAGASAPLPSALNEGPLRLKGWPPVNSASGGGRYLRFATLLSGGAVSAQQLATLTGSDPKEVTMFLQACNELGLIEPAEAPRRTAPQPVRNTGKVGILRSMLAQLTPPKL